ncbi:hypothetical protein PSE10B_45440 [Pseudomonas amygdali pv. eriobotryae]|uniref:Uncharacterized protein n=1 Tax=Pseudomonas amygdali pv. eriobotryae TaxID=129137 RepID=A0A9P3ACP1_PSEA0|nr:hypothetical protein Pta6605_05710 [Pseudomonas amygdali pv. tabaci]GFZ59805.1 hypothetical protein PSE10A_23160 [Pseudomonas amygdali pv. eriobotryae]GFZ68022.1 hypothetical protein PSE10B_45440 [Pseudomonas amygdali pv. eriobotryae]GFZ72371.1 hypothetical protein PSE10C_31130 [Pseudomonas amygdali pv. eriobotryae]
MPLGSSLFSLHAGALRPRKGVPPHSGLRAAKGRDYNVMTKDWLDALKCHRGCPPDGVGNISFSASITIYDLTPVASD